MSRVLALLVLLCGLVIVAQSARAAEKADTSSKPPVRVGPDGEPLPAGALSRVGGIRFRHTGWAIMVAFSPDGKQLATAGNDNLIRIWDPATGRQIRELKGHDHWVN